MLFRSWKDLREQGIYISVNTKVETYAMNIGLSAIITYLTIYIAMVFLITSSALLALQQLMESENNKERYQLLKKLGVDSRMVDRALFMQIAIYFIMPLVLALVHALVGIYVANRVIIVFGEINVLSNILLTAVAFVLVYSAYFLGTYLSSKNMIRD